MLLCASETEMHAVLKWNLVMLGDCLTILLDCSDPDHRLSRRWCQEASNDRLW
jgi:hypothetical protein